MDGPEEVEAYFFRTGRPACCAFSKLGKAILLGNLAEKGCITAASSPEHSRKIHALPPERKHLAAAQCCWTPNMTSNRTQHPAETCSTKGIATTTIPPHTEPDDENIEASSVSTYVGKVFSVKDLSLQLEPSRWLIRGFIPRGAQIGLIYSPPGAGKTFVTLDMCLHIALGLGSWHGHICHKGNVLYIAGESAYPINLRIASFARHHSISLEAASMSVYFINYALSEPGGFERLRKTIREQVPFIPDLVILDTFNSMFSGEENSSQEISAFRMSVLVPLMSRYGCNILIVHHSAKSNETIARGSTAIDGMCDYMLLLTKNDDGILKLSVTKSRIGETGLDEECMITPVELDDWKADEDGIIPSGGVISHVASSAENQSLTDKEKCNLDTLIAAMEQNGHLSEEGCWTISADDFRACLKALGWDANHIKKAFSNTDNRFFPSLVSKNYVTIRKGGDGRLESISLLSPVVNRELSKRLSSGSKEAGTVAEPGV